MARFYKVPRTHLIVDLERIILVSRDDTRTFPPYILKIQMTGTILSTLSFPRLEDLELTEKNLEKALTINFPSARGTTAPAGRPEEEP